MEKDSYCLYRHLKPCGEVFYIGIGKDLRRPYSKNRTAHWKRTVAKYGYEVQILKKNLSKEDAAELEIILIAYYGRMDLGLGRLVNMTDGGDGTLNKSPETRKKISDGQKGELNHRWGLIGVLNPQYKIPRKQEDIEKMRGARPHLRGENSPNFGIKRSSETRKRISENANKPCNCDHYLSKEVIHIYTGIVHCSSAEAADTYGFKRSTLKSMLNGSNPNWTDLRYVESL
jgi:hypothetical protein